VSRKTTCEPIEPKRVVHARLTVRRATVRFYNAVGAGLPPFASFGAPLFQKLTPAILSAAAT
jgi:hypothetical protein